MISISEKARDILNAVGAFIWLALVVVSWTGKPGFAYTGLILVVLLTGIYFVLGTSARGTIGVSVPLFYPILTMVVLWIIAFTVAYKTRGKAATSWILGLHPGQFWPMLLFWVGTFMTSMVSYAVLFDRYMLPDKTWEAFLDEIKKSQSNRENHDTDHAEH